MDLGEERRRAAGTGAGMGTASRETARGGGGCGGMKGERGAVERTYEARTKPRNRFGTTG